MIWSLLKILFFVALVAALTLVAGALLDLHQGLRVQIAGWEFTLTPLAAVIAALALVVVIWLLMKLVGLLVATLRFLNGDETAISRYFDRNRERRGYKAMSEAMLAVAAGEGRLALMRAQRAERYLQKPELTNLLVAQAAELAGDSGRAEAAYKALLGHDETRFVAIHGLLKQKLADGDTDTALALAEKAFALKPRHAATQDILLKLQSDKADWKGARATLGAKLKAGALPRDLFRRRDAVLALQEARGLLDDQSSIEMREAAIEANRKSPDLIPAAAMAARSLTLKGDKKAAARVVRKSWEVQPHPDLAAAFAEIEPEETPAARVKRFAPLIAANPGHDESRLLAAELNVAAEDFPAARRALGDMVTRHPTQRALAIIAAIERGEGADDAIVRGWLAKALTAPRGPQWCCDKCQSIHAEWHPICDNCGGFDTLSWREPVETIGPGPTGAEMLPLIVKPPAPPPPTDDRDEPIDLAAIARSGN